ncbi:MAG: GerMN domain-containing protein [Acidimicrobiales bacterium]
MKIRAGTAALVAALALLAGCGVPTERTARTVPPGNVPFNLLTPHPVEGPTTTTLPFAYSIDVYFTSTQQQRIAPVTEQVKKPGNLTSVIDALLQGPSTFQLHNGYQTAIPSGVRLLDSHLADGIATVNFNVTFGFISGEFESLAVAQVVYSVTANFKTVTGVAFELAGTPLDVPTGAASGLGAGPVSKSQYATLVRPGASEPPVPAG